MDQDDRRLATTGCMETNQPSRYVTVLFCDSRNMEASFLAAATLRELELKCRGAQDVAESWKENHAEVRQLWRIEDLLEELLSCFKLLEYMQKHYERFGVLPNSDTESPYAEYPYFVNILRIYRLGAQLASDAADQFVEYDVARLSELKRSATFVDTVIRNNERPESVQHAIDLINTSVDEQDMTAEEAKDFRQALERPSSTIDVFPVTETTD